MEAQTLVKVRVLARTGLACALCSMLGVVLLPWWRAHNEFGYVLGENVPLGWRVLPWHWPWYNGLDAPLTAFGVLVWEGVATALLIGALWAHRSRVAVALRGLGACACLVSAALIVDVMR